MQLLQLTFLKHGNCLKDFWHMICNLYKENNMPTYEKCKYIADLNKEKKYIIQKL